MNLILNFSKRVRMRTAGAGNVGVISAKEQRIYFKCGCLLRVRAEYELAFSRYLKLLIRITIPISSSNLCTIFRLRGDHKFFGESDFSRVERNFTIGQSPKIWGKFSKISIKINKKLKNYSENSRKMLWRAIKF